MSNMSIGSILILSSFIGFLLISVCIHPESTSACNHSSFPFLVLTFVCMFNSLSLLFCQFEIIY